MSKDSITSKEKKDLSSEVLDFLKDLVIIIIIVKIIITFFAMNFQINGQSMYSSYYDREFIIVDRLSYRFIEPERWDVIVFKPWVSKDKKYFLKRIIATQWDILKVEDWIVYLQKNEEEEYTKLNEIYLDESNNWYTFISGSRKEFEYKVPEGSYFVMWDNRNHSTDSRTCFSSCSMVDASNFIVKKDITWRVWLDLWFFNFKTFSFLHPDLWIDTSPKWLDSFKSYDYE